MNVAGSHVLLFTGLLGVATVLFANEVPIDPNPGNGPYSMPLDDPDNPHDAPVPGFVGPDGEGRPRLEYQSGLIENPNNYVNPLFFDWAASVEGYSLTDDPNAADLYDFMYDYEPGFVDPNNVLGPVTGDHFDIVSLGDLTAQEIADWQADPENHMGPSTLTVTFSAPIEDKSGADFVVFENAFVSNYTTGDGSVTGELWAELAYVEVSSNGVDFFRFPSDSLTPSKVGPYGTLDATEVHNLAGKHSNAYGFSWGTPFDLADVGLTRITHVRLVDIPGSGDFTDNSGDPIYDGWYTWGSGGADIEAIGVVSQEMTYAQWPQLLELDPADRGPEDDPDLDGVSNLAEYAFATLPWSADAEDSRLRIEIDSEGVPTLHLVRDERLVDIVYVLEGTENLADPDSWQPLAISTSGGKFVVDATHEAEINETSLSPIASIEVLRAVTVRDLDSPTMRFYRVRIKEDGP